MFKRSFWLTSSCLFGLLLFGSLTFLAYHVPTAQATDHYYVDAVNGNDVTGDGSQAAPWRTISHALSQVTGPDVEIHVAPGTYNTALGETFPIVMEPAVRLIGDGRENTILFGNGSAHVVHFPGTGFYTETTVLRGFKIMNGNNGVLVSGRTGTPSSPVIEDNWITGNVIGVRNHAVSNQRVAAIIRQNRIEYNTNRGIDLYAGYNGTRLTSVITDNEISHNGTQGIYCYADGSGSSGDSGNSRCNVTISGNVITYNGVDGYRCQTNYAGECRAPMTNNRFIANVAWGISRQHAGTYLITNQPVLVNNVFMGNGTGGADFRSGDRPRFVNNTLAYNGLYGIRNGTPTIVNSIIWGHVDDLNVAVEYVSYSNVGDGEYGGANNNLSVDPQFADPVQHDWHILGTSPLLDAGNSATANVPLTDMDGDPRVLGTAVDIGADETTANYALSIDKSAAPATTVTINDLITYTLTLLNQGAASAAGIEITDALPLQTTWDGYLSASSGTAVVIDGVLQWRGSLPAGATVTIDVAVRVNPLTAVNTAITNIALVGIPGGIITPSNPVTLTVGPGVYWGDSTQIVSQDVLAGQSFTYTIQVVNGGNITASAVTVTDTLDTAVSLVTADQGGVLSNGRVIWSGLSLAPGEMVTLTAVVSTTAPITPNYTAVNQVVVTGGGITYQLPDAATNLWNPAQAVFDAAPTLGPAPLNVNFFNQSQHASSFTWDYGDGSGGTAVGNHNHLYQDGGVYTVTLTAANAMSSQTITHTRFITVYNVPNANFTAAPRLGIKPLLVEFTNSSLYGEQFIWDYGDGVTSTVSSPTHTHVYANTGVYTVRLTAVNAYASHTRVRTNYIGVYNAPVANFTGYPTSGVAPLVVYFDNTSANATMYQWTFGDGQTTVAKDPANIYSQPGVYTVTLTAANPGGSDTLVRSAYITVYGPPTASFTGAPRIGLAPLTVTFNNSSTLADSYLWDYGDGSTSTNSAPTHSYVYDTPGVYTVRLTAFNAYGSNTLTRNNYVQVYDPPIPDFSAAPTVGAEPLVVQFTNLSQNATSYLWTFGDGSTSTAVSPAHTYQNSGIYTVTLRATNPGGSVNLTRTSFITVENAPEPAFAAAPRDGLLTLTTTFTNTSLYATSYIWDYGDGVTSTTSLPVHTHTYTAPGVYDVALTAVNTYATRTHTETAYITVFDYIQADFTAVPTFGPAPLSVNFTNQSQHANSFYWDFGDGSSSTENAPSHLYTAAGLYTVTLTAANPFASHTLTRTQYITVYNQPVPAFTAVPRIGEAPLIVTFTNQSQYADTLIWEYGDGQSAVVMDGQHSHTYTMPGVYTVTLTAVNPYDTQIITRTQYIAVMPPSGQTAYHVDALHGSNSTGDGSLGNPWRTISYAFSQVDQTNVTIYVATGLYNAALGEQFPIVMEPGVRLIGGDRTAAIINGPGTGNVIHFTNAVAYPDTTILRGFKITGGGTGVRIDGANNTAQVPVVDGNWITGNTDGVRTYVYASWRYVYATISHNLISGNGRYGIFNEANSGNQSGQAYTNPTIIGNEISSNVSDGIYCYAYGFSTIDRGHCSPQISGNQVINNGGSGVRAGAGYAGLNNMVLRENVIANNQGWGVRRVEGPTEYWTITRPKLYNNLIYGNSLGGFNVHKEDEAVLVNNTIVNNGAYGIKRENSGERTGYTHVINSIVWGHTDNLNNIVVDWVHYSDLGDGEYTGVNNNVSVDPLFVNPAQNDFHLQPDSPVIDLGDSSRSDLPTLDFEGDPRIWGTAVDMGADEWFDGTVLQMAVTAVPSPATAGQPLTYTVIITSLSQIPVDIVLRDLLPPQVSPTGEVTRSLTFTANQQVQVEQIPVTVNEEYAGPLVNYVEASYLGNVVASEVITTPALVAIAGLTITSDSPTAWGQTTTLTASVAAGTAVSYTWDFGDGSGGSGAVVAHTYAAPGVYTATVIASNAVSNAWAETFVMVAEPVAGLTAVNDSPTALGTPTHLAASITAGTDVSYEWNFGDGATGSGPVVTHVYPTSGIYTATVSAANVINALTTTTTITVYEAISGLAAVSDSPTALGEATQFTATVTAGDDITYTWNFGDGFGGSGATPAHVYNQVGVYTVTVMAVNPVSAFTVTTAVEVQMPISGVVAAHDGPTALGVATHFTATVLDGTAVSFVWDFGDGQTGVGQTTAHTYAAPGVYTTTVTASNAINSYTAMSTVLVEEAVGGLTILVNGSPDTVMVQAHQVVQFEATITGGSNLAYSWDFGDGSVADGRTTAHIFAAPGNYTVRVTAVNNISSQIESVALTVQVTYRLYLPTIWRD
ncbi:MAG TPA: PKD domain-containing protein [Chloroflexota bacterium]|nr:PKD domain-containing protein [Chloroflexota bacterium]